MSKHVIYEKSSDETTIHNIWEVLPEEWHKKFLEEAIEYLKRDTVERCKYDMLTYGCISYDTVKECDLNYRFLEECEDELYKLKNPIPWEEVK